MLNKYLNTVLGCQCKDHNQWGALRIFPNQTAHPLWSLVLLILGLCPFCLVTYLHRFLNVKALVGPSPLLWKLREPSYPALVVWSSVAPCPRYCDPRWRWPNRDRAGAVICIIMAKVGPTSSLQRLQPIDAYQKCIIRDAQGRCSHYVLSGPVIKLKNKETKSFLPCSSISTLHPSG